MNNPELSVILPCLDEEESLGFCIDEIRKYAEKEAINYEIVVVDNDSSDMSNIIGREKKVRVLHEKKRGYGAAYLKGFSHANGKYLFMSDCDRSYDFSELPRFIAQLKNGTDFVIGNRFKGNMQKGAMPFMRRYLGNPILSGVLRFFFKTNIHDAHCGMRAISKNALDKMNLKSIGMEFASEMVIAASVKKLKTMELPINYLKRGGKSKLNPFRDGLRHLKYIFSAYYSNKLLTDEE